MLRMACSFGPVLWPVRAGACMARVGAPAPAGTSSGQRVPPEPACAAPAHLACEQSGRTSVPALELSLPGPQNVLAAVPPPRWHSSHRPLAKPAVQPITPLSEFQLNQWSTLRAYAKQCTVPPTTFNPITWPQSLSKPQWLQLSSTQPLCPGVLNHTPACAHPPAPPLCLAAPAQPRPELSGLRPP
jgi:hypothetical protein